MPKTQGFLGPNGWKCIEIVNPTITTLFCIILNLFRSHQLDLSGFLVLRSEARGYNQNIIFVSK